MKIWITPFEASVPYSVAAAAPFRISTRSMDSGVEAGGAPLSVEALHGGAVHADAVHVHDRFVQLRQRRGPADPDAGAFAGVARRGQRHHSGFAARDELA
ncbi:MAG: hypothetical protein OXI39_00160, partial [Gemmatimonadota bacterium]|uniref:hypothetical protein n=1 Tax=Candidatus Palauibacter scopulicola TaxID=3056741 RepID=UPI00239929A5